MFIRLTRQVFFAIVLFLSPALALAGIQTQVHEIVRSAGLQNTKVAIFIADLDNNNELVAINIDEPMIPASNMKLFVSAAALHILGPDHVFRTELRLADNDDRMTEQHDNVSAPASKPATDDGSILIIHGDGDPAFCDPKVLQNHNLDTEQLLQTWVQAVQDAGVDKVQRLIVDERVFDRKLIHPSWPSDQLNMWYCAQIAGLNINTNCIDVYVDPTQLNQSPRIKIFPDSPFITTLNRAITGRKDTFWISRKPNTNELTFRGQVKNRRTAPVYATIHDPPKFLGQLLASRLEKIGITVKSINRPAPDELLPPTRTLHVVQTTLPLVLQRCNKDSQNLYAEALLKRTGRKFTGSPGSWENGAAAVRAFLNRQIGARGAMVVITDGSGLSRNNRITTRVMINLLQAMWQDATRGPLFRESLSIGGRDGTLRKRFKQGLTGRVYGKSGYIDGVSSLSGYLILPEDPADNNRQERTIAFSFIFNNIKPPIYVHHIKKLQNELIQLIDQHVASMPAVGIGG